MNFNAHNEKNNKIMASYICGWMGEKSKGDMEGLINREKKAWTRAETGHMCQILVALCQ